MLVTYYFLCTTVLWKYNEFSAKFQDFWGKTALFAVYLSNLKRNVNVDFFIYINAHNLHEFTLSNLMTYKKREVHVLVFKSNQFKS